MTRNLLPIAISYDPPSDTGIASVYGGVCAGLVWLRDGQVQPIDDVSVGEGEQRFPLGAQVRAASSEACQATGQAAWPDIAPDGSRIAFVASPESVGVPIADRWDQPFGLYVMSTADSDPIRILDGLRSPRGVRWAPDGSSLLISGSIDGDGEGVWLVDPADGSRDKVASMDLGGIAWAPDGSAFAGIDTPLPADGSAPTRSDVLVVPIPAGEPLA
jgi:hypothetical protein